MNRVLFGGSVVFIDPLKSQKCRIEYWVKDTLTHPIHLLLQKEMKSRYSWTSLISNLRIQPKVKNITTHEKSLANPDWPPKRCPCTSDRSGPTYLPCHHPHLPPARSLQHLASEAPPPEGSCAIRHFEAIFASIFNGAMSCNNNTYPAPRTSERLQEGGRKQKEVSTAELGIWLGIVIYMGVHNSPALRDDWRYDGFIKAPNIWARPNLRR